MSVFDASQDAEGGTCVRCGRRIDLFTEDHFDIGGRQYHKKCFRCDMCKGLLEKGEFGFKKGSKIPVCIPCGGTVNATRPTGSCFVKASEKMNNRIINQAASSPVIVRYGTTRMVREKGPEGYGTLERGAYGTVDRTGYGTLDRGSGYGGHGTGGYGTLGGGGYGTLERGGTLREQERGSATRGHPASSRHADGYGAADRPATLREPERGAPPRQPPPHGYGTYAGPAVGEGRGARPLSPGQASPAYATHGEWRQYDDPRGYGPPPHADWRAPPHADPRSGHISPQGAQPGARQQAAYRVSPGHPPQGPGGTLSELDFERILLQEQARDLERQRRELAQKEMMFYETIRAVEGPAAHGSRVDARTVLPGEADSRQAPAAARVRQDDAQASGYSSLGRPGTVPEEYGAGPPQANSSRRVLQAGAAPTCSAVPRRKAPPPRAESSEQRQRQWMRLKTGWLGIECSDGHTWKRRFFMLLLHTPSSSLYLNFYPNEHDLKSMGNDEDSGKRGEIGLFDDADAYPSEKKEFGFFVASLNRKFHLCTESDADQRSWVSTIKQAVSNPQKLLWSDDVDAFDRLSRISAYSKGESSQDKQDAGSKSPTYRSPTRMKSSHQTDDGRRVQGKKIHDL